MLRPALIIVDVQNDFLPGGSLAVPQGDKVVPRILELLDLRRFPWAAVAVTQDWHPRNHCLFAANHNVEPFSEVEMAHPLGEKNAATGHIKTSSQTVWPVHCVQETEGAAVEHSVEAKISHVAPHVPVAVVRKGYLQDREYYLCFSDWWKIHQTEMGQFLMENSITDVVFVGLAYDFCVLHSAIDCLDAGFSTYVIQECSKSVYPDRELETTNSYTDAGVTVVPTIADLVRTIAH